MKDKKNSKSENRIFALLMAAVIVFGSLMLLWGQRNSAEQVMEIAFLNYRVAEQLSNDEDYSFSEEDSEKYTALLAEAEAWKKENPGTEKTFTASSAGERYADFAVCDMKYTYYDNSSDITVILVHGYEETADNASVYAPFWCEKGYNIIIPELKRIQGELQISTFGVYEQYDLYDLIIAEGLQNSEIILHGRGAGAAACLLLDANESLSCNIGLIAAESVYSDMNTLKTDQLKAQFGLGEYFTGKLLTTAVYKQFGINMNEISIASAAAATETPKLFICGEADTFMLPEYTQTVYDAAGGKKALVIIAGAKNRMSYAASEEEYRTALAEFADEVILNIRS